MRVNLFNFTPMIKQEISLERLFPQNTVLRFALFDYLSEYYPISDDLLIKGKYFWNYDLMLNNERISALLKIVINAFSGKIPEDIRYIKSRVKLSIEMVRDVAIKTNTKGVDTLISSYNLLKGKKVKEIIPIIKKLDNIYNPKEYCEERRYKDVDLSGDIIYTIIKSLHIQKQYDFTPSEVLHLCKQYRRLQSTL